jgi:esterase/lipase
VSKKYFLSKKENILLFIILISLLTIVLNLSSWAMAGDAKNNIEVRDYIENKFDSAIFHLYLESMGVLDSQEIEFIDLLTEQPTDRQMFYGKKVYEKGYDSALIEQLKTEIEESEKLIREEVEEIVTVDEPSLPTLPSMKFWEKLFARMISMQKVIGTTEINRFSYCGVDAARSERVVKRVKNYFDWCNEWTKEGKELKELAKNAEREGNIFLARQLYHSAAGCYHIGNYLNYYDVEEKIEAQKLARECYKKAIALYDEKERPIKIDIHFQGVEIPGYLMLSGQPNKPLIIFVNVLNNLKEVENHLFAQDFLKAGFNIFNFDGPGQGEMHQKMLLVPDYEKSIHAIIDWFEKNNEYDIDLERIGVVGISFGGFFSIKAAATDPRIDCVIGNGGFAYFPSLSHLKKINIFMERSIYYMTGYKSMKELSKNFGHLDIKKSQPLDRPMLIIQGGKDEVVPNKHAYYYMEWAESDEKELLFIEDANHCCQDYFDIIVPYMIDWLGRHLL